MSAAKTMAEPAQFDRASQRRRSMMGKVHIACKELGLHKDDYMQLLLDYAGETSLTQCSEAQIVRVLDRLKQLGFVPLKSPKAKGAADHKVARKARAMWMSLYQLGAVHNPSETALEAFATRTLGCQRLAWAKQRNGYLLIEALKDWANRVGWDQSGQPTVRQLKERLCEAILGQAKAAGMVPAEWHLSTAARKICGFETSMVWSETDYEHVAEALSTELRTYRAKVSS